MLLSCSTWTRQPLEIILPWDHARSERQSTAIRFCSLSCSQSQEWEYNTPLLNHSSTLGGHFISLLHKFTDNIQGNLYAYANRQTSHLSSSLLSIADSLGARLSWSVGDILYACRFLANKLYSVSTTMDVESHAYILLCMKLKWGSLRISSLLICSTKHPSVYLCVILLLRVTLYIYKHMHAPPDFNVHLSISYICIDNIMYLRSHLSFSHGNPRPAFSLSTSVPGTLKPTFFRRPARSSFGICLNSFPSWSDLHIICTESYAWVNPASMHACGYRIEAMLDNMVLLYYCSMWSH